MVPPVTDRGIGSFVLLIAACRQNAGRWWSIDQLPYFAMPRYVEFRVDLPLSPIGRVLKRDLRHEGVTPGTWDSVAAGAEHERR
jgi:hypothetical protein